MKCETVLSSFWVVLRPSQCEYLILRDVCGCARAQTWPRSPGINVATHKSQSCCLAWCSCFLQSAEVIKPTLMFRGAGGCAAGFCTLPLAVRMSLHCLWQSCLLQNSTGIPAPFETFLFGLRCDADPFLGLWACMLFAFLHCVPCMWNQHPGTKRKKTWMEDATCRSPTHSLQKAKRAQNCGHKFGSWAINFSIVASFLGPESGLCFGATKHKQELANTGGKRATADASWQQHISVIYIYIIIIITIIIILMVMIMIIMIIMIIIHIYICNVCM